MPYSSFDIATACLQAGELPDALAALDTHLAQHPADDAARRMRIGILRHLGDAQQVQAALDDMQHLTDPQPADRIQQSLLLEQAGRIDEARHCLADAHMRWPQDERLTERYLNLLLAHDLAADALVMIRQQPQTWRWLQWEGDALVRLGDDLMATARYGLALAQLDAQITPDNALYFGPIQARLLLARAAAYQRLDMLDQATPLYAAAEALIPNDPTISFNRGLLAWRRDEQAEALRLCRAALAASNESLRTRLLADLAADSRFKPLLLALTMKE